MPEPRRHANVVNHEEAQVMPIEKGKHRVKVRQLSRAAGGAVIGGNVTELAPRSVSFPFHYHCATEEAIYVLSGSGLARIGEQRVRVRPGDWIAYPVGPDHAHQMINDTDEPLTYLCVSASVVKVD